MSSLSALTDEELLSRISNDCRYAFTELYNRYWDRLFAIAASALGSAEEGEEVVHDVFLKLWKLRRTLEVRRSLNHYLAAAVKYHVINRLRLWNRRRQLFAQNVAEAGPQNGSEVVETWFREKELMEELERTVSRLPEKCQLVYRLSREMGYNSKQIAEELNVSVNTVDTHLGRALRVLKLHFHKVISLLIALTFQVL